MSYYKNYFFSAYYEVNEALKDCSYIICDPNSKNQLGNARFFIKDNWWTNYDLDPELVIEELDNARHHKNKYGGNIPLTELVSHLELTQLEWYYKKLDAPEDDYSSQYDEPTITSGQTKFTINILIAYLEHVLKVMEKQDDDDLYYDDSEDYDYEDYDLEYFE